LPKPVHFTKLKPNEIIKGAAIAINMTIIPGRTRAAITFLSLN
jgi:hypothetical protein